jgi:hypothetical protein
MQIASSINAKFKELSKLNFPFHLYNLLIVNVSFYFGIKYNKMA